MSEKKTRSPVRTLPITTLGLRPPTTNLDHVKEQVDKLRATERRQQRQFFSAEESVYTRTTSGGFDFCFEPKPSSGPPPELLREERRRDRARNRRAPRPGERVTLEMALYLASRGPWRDPSERKRREQAEAAIRALAGMGRAYVDSVTERDLRALIEKSHAEGLSVAAIKFRLSCLSALGVKARVWQQ
jgi:hypothetical protein